MGHLGRDALKTYPLYPPYDTSIPSALQGEVLTFSPRNKLVLSANYTLPLAPEIGRVTVGSTHAYTDEQLATNGTPYGVPPEYSILNLNLDWTQINGKPLDLTLFATNVTNTKYTTYIAGLYDAIGAESRQLGEPQMYGVRLRWRFGA